MAARKQVKETPAELGARDLELGHEGDDVKVVQALVLAPVTGVYDAATVKAVKSWQVLKNLPPTGTIDQYGWKRVGIDTGETITPR